MSVLIAESEGQQSFVVTLPPRIPFHSWRQRISKWFSGPAKEDDFGVLRCMSSVSDKQI
jgi:hypothetical protein